MCMYMYVHAHVQEQLHENSDMYMYVHVTVFSCIQTESIFQCKHSILTETDTSGLPYMYMIMLLSLGQPCGSAQPPL